MQTEALTTDERRLVFIAEQTAYEKDPHATTRDAIEDMRDACRRSLANHKPGTPGSMSPLDLAMTAARERGYSKYLAQMEQADKALYTIHHAAAHLLRNHLDDITNPYQPENLYAMCARMKAESKFRDVLRKAETRYFSSPVVAPGTITMQYRDIELAIECGDYADALTKWQAIRDEYPSNSRNLANARRMVTRQLRRLIATTGYCGECGTHSDDCGPLTNGYCWSCKRRSDDDARLYA